MRKFFRRSCAVILAASMVFAQSVTAFAGTDDSNYGPGFTDIFCNGFHEKWLHKR